MYRGYEVVTTPSPSGGEQILRALELLESRDPIAPTARRRWYRALAEVILAVFREREGRFPSIAEEPGETTHLCTADRQGNVVALTQSIQTHFGAGVAHPTGGFLYNNYLTTCPRHRHPHRLRSRCQPRSNAAPTLVLRPDAPTDSAKPFLALGAAGSRRITSAIVHVLSAVIDRGLSLGKAIALPRVHATLAGQLWLERRGVLKRLAAQFAADYRKVVTKRRYSDSMGVVQALQFLDGFPTRGAADPRRDGSVSVIAE
jgi:gamma-glutamyltranspeptidase/glutathione hydrolase